MAQTLGWLLVLPLLIFCSCAQSFLQGRTATTSGFFMQTLNHFSKKNLSFWSQRYYVNNNFYKPGGPVFLMIEGQRPASMQWLNKNYTWITYAKRLGALCFLLEHRFYGCGQPTRDLSTKSLRLYLSSRQAVADIAKFRTKIARTRRLTKNKWVVFGGGYGGSLAVWSRIKHPDLFAAAVGSSAPIQGKVNFYEYFEVIYKTLATHNRECPGAVKRAYGLIMYMLLLPHYHSKLKFDYKLCEPLTINSEMEQFFILENLMLITAAIVQSNKKNNTIMGKPGEISIDEFCEKMTDTSLGLPYDRYASIVNTMLRNKRFHCFPASYKNYVKEYSKSSSKNIVYRRGRQWLYQCCTEFGYFFTTDFKNHSFSGLPLRYYVKKCSDVFGLEFNNDSLVQSVMATNRYYGGFNVSGSKIIFSNGSNDPWYPMGITKDISKDLPAVFIKGEAHCGDMLQPQDTDSAELIQAREKIFQILQKWLKK